MDVELEEMVENFLQDDSEAAMAERRQSELLGTPQGRLTLAFEKYGAGGHDRGLVLARFVTREISCEHGMMSARLRVYSPPLDEMWGRILVEEYNRAEGNLFFEIEIRKETDFSSMVMDDMGSDAWTPFFRYHELFLSPADARSFLKELVFCGCFCRTFFMTTPSDALNDLTTQDLLSEKGQMLSFRAWSQTVW